MQPLAERQKCTPSFLCRPLSACLRYTRLVRKSKSQNQHGTVRTTAGHSTDARGRVRRAALPTWDPNKRTQMLSEQHSPVTLHQAHRANRPLNSHTPVRKCPARPSTAPMRRPRARQALHKQAHTGGGARGVLHALLEQLSFGRVQANCSRQTLLLMTQHRTSPARKPSASRCPSAPFEMLTECNPLSCLLRPTFRPKRTSNSTSNTTGKMAWRTAALPTALEGAFATSSVRPLGRAESACLGLGPPDLCYRMGAHSIH